MTSKKIKWNHKKINAKGSRKRKQKELISDGTNGKQAARCQI